MIKNINEIINKYPDNEKLQDYKNILNNINIDKNYIIDLYKLNNQTQINQNQTQNQNQNLN